MVAAMSPTVAPGGMTHPAHRRAARWSLRRHERGDIEFQGNVSVVT